jgi:hypothetical protein
VTVNTNVQQVVAQANEPVVLEAAPQGKIASHPFQAAGPNTDPFWSVRPSIPICFG